MSSSSTSPIKFDGLPFRFGRELSRAEQAAALDAYLEALRPVMPKLAKHSLLELYDNAHAGPRGTNKRIEDYKPEVIPGESGYTGATRVIGHWEAYGKTEHVTREIKGVENGFRVYTLLFCGMTNEAEWVLGLFDFEEHVSKKGKPISPERFLPRISLLKPESTEHMLELSRLEATTVLARLFLPWVRGRVGLAKREYEDMEAFEKLSLDSFSALNAFQGKDGKIRPNRNRVQYYTTS